MSESQRRWLWAGIATAVVVLIAVALAPTTRQFSLDRRLSTLRTTPDGAAALYETLLALGVRVERRVTPLVGAAPIDRPIALLAPTERLTPRETAALLDWIAGGGDAIVAVWPFDPLLSRLGFVSKWVGEPAGAETVSDSVLLARPTSHPWVEGIDAVGPVREAMVETVKSDVPTTTPLLVGSGGKGLVAVLVAHGNGRLLLIADPTLLANESIRESGMMPLIARAAVDMTSAGAVLSFDEYHHGQRGGSVAGGVWTFLAHRPAGRSVLQLAMVGVLSLLPIIIRFGTAQEPRRAPRRSPLEHVTALGEVYRQARAESIARRRLLDGFARRIGREHVRPGHELEFLERLQSRVPVGAVSVAAVAEAWRDPRTDLVELVRRMEHALNLIRK